MGYYPWFKAKISNFLVSQIMNIDDTTGKSLSKHSDNQKIVKIEYTEFKLCRIVQSLAIIIAYSV